MQSYNNNITLIKWTKTSSTLVHISLKLNPLLFDSKFVNFVNFFLQLWYHFPLEKNVAFIEQIDSLSPRDALCQLWLKFVPWFWRRQFLNFVCFQYYVIIFLSKSGVTLHPRINCSKFCWKWSSGSGEF